MASFRPLVHGGAVCSALRSPAPNPWGRRSALRAPAPWLPQADESKTRGRPAVLRRLHVPCAARSHRNHSPSMSSAESDDMELSAAQSRDSESRHHEERGGLGLLGWLGLAALTVGWVCYRHPTYVRALVQYVLREVGVDTLVVVAAWAAALYNQITTIVAYASSLRRAAATALYQAIDKRLRPVEDQIADLATSLSAEVKSARDDVQSVREDMQSVRQDVQGIRDDLQSTRRVLRDELQCVQKAQDVISAAVKADAAS